MKIKFILFLWTATLLWGCGMLGEEIARISVPGVSANQVLQPGQTTVSLIKGDEISIWSDMDLAYEGDLQLQFKMEARLGGEIVENIGFDPFKKSQTLGEVRTQLNGKVEWRFSGKHTNFVAPRDGAYTFEAILIASQNSSLVLKKSDIVLKN